MSAFLAVLCNFSLHQSVSLLPQCGVDRLPAAAGLLVWLQSSSAAHLQLRQKAASSEETSASRLVWPTPRWPPWVKAFTRRRGTIKIQQNNSVQNSVTQSPQLRVKSFCFWCVREMLVPLYRIFDMVSCGSDIELYLARHLHVHEDWWWTHGSKDCNITSVHFSPDRTISVTTGWVATTFCTDVHFSLKTYLVTSCATISFIFVFWAKLSQQLPDGLLLNLAQVPLLCP